MILVLFFFRFGILFFLFVFLLAVTLLLRFALASALRLALLFLRRRLCFLAFALLDLTRHFWEKLLLHNIAFNLAELDLHLEVAVILDTLLVLVSVLSHVFIDQQNAVGINKGRVKPEMEQLFLLIWPVKEFNLDVVVDQNLLRRCTILLSVVFLVGAFLFEICSQFESGNEVTMRHTLDKCRLLVLYTVVEEHILTIDLVRRLKSTFGNVRSCDDSNLKQLHYSCRHLLVHLMKGRYFPIKFILLNVLFQLDLFCIGQKLQEMIKVVDIPDLAWNGHTLCVVCSDLAVVNQSILSFLNYERTWLEESILHLSVSVKHQIRTDHYSCPSLASFAMNRCYILSVLAQELITVAAKLVENFKRWRVVVIKGEVFVDRTFVEACPAVLALRTQVVNHVVLRVFFGQEALDVSD
jgi:hypothetical protein